MFTRNVQVIIGLIYIAFVKEILLVPRGGCDLTPNAWFSEGNMGEAGVFPWLGILRVHLHDVNTLKIALTGLVLVRDKYAIANADDVTRIPRKIFKEDSKAMFIATDKEPWYSKLKDYMTHPEYEFSTFNTIALLELDLGEDNFNPVKPICWPSYSFNTSNQLYALGYTDDNQLLEKTLYKLQYVNPTLCEEFYNRAGLVEAKMAPTHYVCGFAANNRENCVWDNGMVLASNSSGVWTLIGFGIHGPGCAAPARFIDMIPYLSWIESATSLYETNVYPDYRKKSAFSEGFKRRPKKVEIEDIPVHELFSGSRRKEDLLKDSYFKYPFDTEVHQNRYFFIDRIDKDAIMITKIADMHGKCSDYKTTVFHEMTKIVGTSMFLTGVATYRLTLYDWHVSNYTCIMIKVECTNKEQAKLYYNTYLDRKEGSAISDFGDTPEELLKTFPITPTSETYKEKPPQNLSDGNWQPGRYLKPIYIEDEINTQNITNVNLLIRFEFKGEGSLKIRLFGPPTPPTTTTPAPWNKTTTTTKEKARIGPKISYAGINWIPLVNSNKAETRSKGRVHNIYSCYKVMVITCLSIILN